MAYFMQQLAPHASSVSVVGHDCPSAILVIIHYSVGTDPTKIDLLFKSGSLQSRRNERLVE